MSVRVRFAPSPTGLMHIGGVRTALLNYLFAHQKQGTFILRIEDTDAARDFDPGAKKIMHDLAWLQLNHDEGPLAGGPYGPYFQSQRAAFYQEHLAILKEQKSIYRCFCSNELLEQNRQRALALKIAPRYDRICFTLSAAQIEERIAQGVPFIWRFSVPQEGKISITDMAHGSMDFELKNFADFPLTRADGSFTFIFSNAVDDILMAITHVIRGADHLSNTANQALIYKAFNKDLPLFWHLPILCNVTGKKLSKRDFGFNLDHLKEEGYLPEAIINYVAILGSSYTDEIMSSKELINIMNFSTIKPTGNIKYDVDKLKWINHKWLQKYEPEALVNAVLPLLAKAYPSVTALDQTILSSLLQSVKPEMSTLLDAIPALHFYFYEPTLTAETIKEHIAEEHLVPLREVLKSAQALLASPTEFVKTAQSLCKEKGIPTKALFNSLRLALTGTLKGPALAEVITLLGIEKSKERLKLFIQQ